MSVGKGNRTNFSLFRGQGVKIFSFVAIIYKMNLTTPIHNSMRMIMLLSVFGLWGCNNNMKKEDNLESWLEKNFPGQFTIVQSLRDLQGRHLIEHKVNALVAETKDPEVQFSVAWYKGKPDVGLTIDEIRKADEDAARDIKSARDWYAKLTTAGIERISVGVVDEGLYVLPYSEPTPEMRKEIITKLFSVLKQESGSTQTQIWIECMEDSTYRKEIKEVAPFGYWHRVDSYHDDHKIMSVEFEISEDVNPDEVGKLWAFNTKSLRSLEFIKQAYAEARQWTDEHVAKSNYLEAEQMVRYELDENDPLAVHYTFPLYASKPEDPGAYGVEDSAIGFITGVFNTDEKKFTKIKKVKEL